MISLSLSLSLTRAYTRTRNTRARARPSLMITKQIHKTYNIVASNVYKNKALTRTRALARNTLKKIIIIVFSYSKNPNYITRTA